MVLVDNQFAVEQVEVNGPPELILAREIPIMAVVNPMHRTRKVSADEEIMWVFEGANLVGERRREEISASLNFLEVLHNSGRQWLSLMF